MNVEVFDNGGRTFDRYTAIFPDGSALLIGPTGNAPNGVCMHGEPGYVESDGEQVEFDSLPEPVQRAIRAEWATWYTPGGWGYEVTEQEVTQ